jgi:hypothetical protein
MNSQLFRKPTITAQQQANRYDSLRLNDNPFPQRPTLVPTSPDPRENGEIYCDDLHSDKASGFRQLLIPTAEGRPIHSIAFLMDAASRRGRGIGKSAFLKHQQTQIMADLGKQASGGAAVLFAAYIVPTASPPCRKFWEFCRLLFETMYDQKILSLAIWRLRGLYGDVPEAALAKVGTAEQWEDTIGSDKWLNQEKVNTWELNQRVQERLVTSGVPEEVAFQLAHQGAKPLGIRSKWVADSFWRKNGPNMIFDWLVRMFRAAEFTRGILLVDELEKIVVHQNILERRSFVESLRYYLIDGNCQNARDKFFGMLLTIHPIIQELLLSHWQSAGLDRLAPLNEPEAKQCTLYLLPLDKIMALPLVTVYLDHYRKLPGDRGKIRPFSEDAVVEALVRSGGVPGKTLNLLHRVIEYAADNSLTKVGKGVVDKVASEEPVLPPDKEDLSALPATRISLAEEQ